MPNPRSTPRPRFVATSAEAVSLRAGAACAVLLGSVLLAGCAGASNAGESGPRWLAGDHHIHSRFSVGWDDSTDPPTPIIAGDAIYPIPTNAEQARAHGLSWMVATDHGGPNHSRVNLEQAYPELLEAREAVPEVIQFFGMEFDSPGADHSSMIVPHTHDEAERVHAIESRFSRNEPWPPDSTWDTEPRMIEALEFMDGMDARPVVIANHPSRSATEIGVYGYYDPAELRNWNDAAPEVAVGMAGAPGHQAVALDEDGTVTDGGPRGGYGRAPTMGGFDQMTARLGGFWDSMLGEGRRWWITANSDSHIHYTQGGVDFWPGEYSKTWVWAEPTHDAILEGLRRGRVFVALGDLITALDVAVVAGGDTASLGDSVMVAPGASLDVTVRFRDPVGPNHNGDDPSVSRVDLIVGEVRGPVTDRATDTNPTTRVVARFTASDWSTDGEWRTFTHRLGPVDGPLYLRLRGTNGQEPEPGPDPRTEDPWTDLWFYSNPVFVGVR
ncbi:MAG: hypothetical protein RJQ04_21510 [Longimicrobiales bacterium]